jgi:hypothetical protein
MRGAKTTGNGYSLAADTHRPHDLRPAGPDAARGAASAHGRPVGSDKVVDGEIPSPVRGIAGNGAGTTAASAAADPLHGREGVHREENRRNERRQRVLKRGKILTNDGFSTVDCVIRDLSERGARVVVEAECATQLRFSLLFMDTGFEQHAERRWQKGREIGVRFVD